MNSTPAINLLGQFRWLQLLTIVMLSACSSPALKKDIPPDAASSVPIIEKSKSDKEIPSTEETTKEALRLKPELAQLFSLKSDAHLTSVSWSELPSWESDQFADGIPALLQSCRVVQKFQEWKDICQEARLLVNAPNEKQRHFYESNFSPFKVHNEDKTDAGLVTGYYEPLLLGSLKRSKNYPYPVYATPDDLISVDASTHPLLKNFRGVGRKLDGELIPYFTRAEIDQGLAEVKGTEILWVKDKIELFFLQIQGSGRVELEDGTTIRLGFAKSNGHPYRSIGKTLVSRGELKLSQASMQGIKEWAQRNPKKIDALLHENPSYVFFRKLPSNLDGPIGSLGVPLTPNRSIAVDDTYIPSGFPVYLATTQPNSSASLNRLVFAQDKGGAIKGAVRADYFWGFGESAAVNAGKMKQKGFMWVLVPKTFLLATNFD